LNSVRIGYELTIARLRTHEKKTRLKLILGCTIYGDDTPREVTRLVTTWSFMWNSPVELARFSMVFDQTPNKCPQIGHEVDEIATQNQCLLIDGLVDME
jgi:hypothetical protein